MSALCIKLLVLHHHCHCRRAISHSAADVMRVVRADPRAYPCRRNGLRGVPTHPESIVYYSARLVCKPQSSSRIVRTAIMAVLISCL